MKALASIASKIGHDVRGIWSTSEVGGVFGRDHCIVSARLYVCLSDEKLTHLVAVASLLHPLSDP
jgi:hypothetical protein